MTRHNGPKDDEGKPRRPAAPTGRGPGGRAAISRGGPGGSVAAKRRAKAPEPGTDPAAAPAGKARKSESAPPRRKAAGFLHAAAMTRAPVSAAFGKRGFAEARVLLDWREIVGEALAGVCRPIKVSYAAKGFGATLVVMAPGARAPEVEMLAPRIVERVNAHYGYRAIARVKVTQTARGADGAFAGALAEDAREFERARRVVDPAAALPATEAARVARTVSPVGDEGLRAALDRLGRNIKARDLRKRDAGGA